MARQEKPAKWFSQFARHTGNLSKRMLFYILLCSTFFALLISLFQLTWDYHTDVSLVEDSVSQIELSHLQPIASSLWALDEEQLQTEIDGILSLPNMQYVQVKEMFGIREIHYLDAGKKSPQYDIVREFELKYQQQIIGRLLVAASLDLVYQRLWEKALIILVGQTIKTLVVSFAILFIIFNLVIRHLNTIARYTRGLNLDSLGAPLTLSRKSQAHQDELTQMVDTFNHMRQKIHQELNARVVANQQLAKERDFSTTVIKASNAVITCLDEELKILVSNPASARLSGYSQQALLGQNWFKVYDRNYRPDAVKNLLQLHRLENQELTMVGGNGVTSVLLWNFIPFYEKDSACRVIAFGYDISHLKSVEQELLTLNNQLEDKVMRRTEKLQSSNLELAGALKQLKETQRSLLEADKMAALGNLVAGVAHEINTPIGNSITLTSHLQDQLKNIRKFMEDGTLTKKIFMENLAVVSDSISLLHDNQQRAAELVRSFKQVAVDQSAQSRHPFNVKENLQRVLTSLQQEIFQAQCQVNVHCDELLMIDSYPGSFMQIYSHLIRNSIRHGFDDWQGEKTITIDIKMAQDHMTIDYRDSGRGVSADIAPRIFEPFITTRRAKGSAGLGSHIVFNLVVHLLRGTIKYLAQYHGGAAFSIHLPCTFCAKQASKIPAD